MRVVACLLFLVALAGMCVAQSSDTNFASGPQYLVTTDSTLFLQPISTPSMSFPAGLTTPASSTSGTPTSSPAPAIQATPDLARILWTGEPPSAETSSVVEISSAAPTKALPASLFETGVTGFIGSQSLPPRGYGVTPGDAATAGNSRPHATRVFTNADIQRLHNN